MVERVRNVVKRDRKKGVKSVLIEEEEGTSDHPAKRKSKQSDLLRRYPCSTSSPSSNIDTDSLLKHEEAITTKLSKPKPRESIFLPLMKSTYQTRRIYILNEALCVSSILSKYPAFSRAAVVRQLLHQIDSSIANIF